MVDTATAAPAIAVRGLTKRFGTVLAVDDLSFDVVPGRVTGFLGPNGAGKTTTLRMVLGLVEPTGGTALVNGAPYRRLTDPVGRVGAVLESSGFHPARSARNALRVVAAAGGVGARRVDEVLALVGLADNARRNVGGFSLGMRQRLELARALLGDPGILVLDEPANGLDPQGIAWLRTFLRWYAAQGRVVLVSSHLLAEAEQTLDDVIVLSGGRLAAQGPVARLAQMMGRAPEVRVRTPEPDRLAQVLAGAGITARRESADVVAASGVRAEEVGPVMAVAQIVVYDMRSTEGSLEEVFFALTNTGTGIAPMGGAPTPPGGPGAGGPGTTWPPPVPWDSGPPDPPPGVPRL